MDLAAWQGQLEHHFGDLRERRSATVGQRPIFGLEHGLAPDEIESLQRDLRAGVAEGPPSVDHFLPWVVYASEVGYQYFGDEYWQTFEESTPGWGAFGERDWLRRIFRRFHDLYGGAKPVGPWANHFSIICWPITHAILPKDLQRQLAEILYYMRDLFSADLLASPQALGEQIAARSWGAASRFQNLAQEPLLIGQIAAALLLQGAEHPTSLILPAALKRIGEDLDRARSARDWLRGARRVAQERTQFRGLSSGVVDYGGVRPETTEGARAAVAALAIEPRLVLRPAGADTWDVRLELPDLTHLLARFPALHPTLTDSRCVVAGSSGRPLPRGALLHGPQLVTLTSWPSPTEALLRFEQAVPPEFQFLLRAECLLRPGPQWLFRFASDGLGYELRGHVVRPAHAYAVVSSAGPISSGSGLTPLKLRCSGVHGARVGLPSTIPDDWLQRLQGLGLSAARSVRVWPAGLAAARWDGEGRAEWLASERPCVAVLVDHAIDGMTVVLRSGADVQRLKVSPSVSGSLLLVELPLLPVGVHKLCITTFRRGQTADEPTGELEILIREPRPWSPGVNPEGALSVRVEPTAPTLDQIWEGRAAIEIDGPAGRVVTATVSLLDKRSPEPIVIKRLPTLRLPVNAVTWRNVFERSFRRARDSMNLYDLAHACEVTIDAEDLGRFSLLCERDFVPLRWHLRRESTGYQLALIDDSGVSSKPELYRYAFQRPDVAEPGDATLFEKPAVVPATGGLYLARSGEHSAATILPPMVRDLHDLGCAPQLKAYPRSLEGVTSLLKLVGLWFNARVTGEFFSVTRQQEVLVAFTRQIFSVVGGANWELAERSIHPGPDGLRDLRRAVTSRREEVGLGEALALEAAGLSALNPRQRVARFSSLTQKFLHLPTSPTTSRGGPGNGVVPDPLSAPSDHPQWLAELALRLASCPEGVRLWAGRHLSDGVARLLATPTLARAARFEVLAISEQLRQPRLVAQDQPYPGWEWE